jgi:CDP-L-myo-inositol myo-inositolphosphotransferase
VASDKIYQAIVLATQANPMAVASKGHKQFLGEVRVGGVSLLKRALLTLERQGLRRYTVVVADSAVRDNLAGDPQIAALDVHWVINDERPEDDGYSVLLAGAEVVGDFIVVPADRVFEPKIAKQLLQRSHRGVMVAVSDNGDTGLFSGGRALLSDLLVREAKAEPMDMGSVMTDLVAADELTTLDVGAAYCQPIRDKQSLKKADSLLLNALRKPVDGIVARYVNRNFSLAVTRLIRNTPIRPNHITGVSLGIAFLGAYASAQATPGSYWWLIVGAFLWQLASMMDGVDGELARLKFSGSKLGEWLDTLSDDIGRLVFFIGAGIGTSAVFGSSVWLVVLALAVTTQLGLSLPLYRKLLQTGSGSHFALSWDSGSEDKTLWSRFKAHTGFLSRRDTYIAMWLGFSIIGMLKFAIVITSAITFFVLVNELLTPRTVRTGFVATPERKRPADPVLTR